MDKGFGENLSTTTLKKGAFAFIFDRIRTNGGIGIRGTEITRLNLDR